MSGIYKYIVTMRSRKKSILFFIKAMDPNDDSTANPNKAIRLLETICSKKFIYCPSHHGSDIFLVMRDKGHDLFICIN